MKSTKGIQASEYPKDTYDGYFEVFQDGNNWSARVYSYSKGLVAEGSGTGSADQWIRTEMNKLKRSPEGRRKI